MRRRLESCREKNPHRADRTFSLERMRSTRGIFKRAFKDIAAKNTTRIMRDEIKKTFNFQMLFSDPWHLGEHREFFDRMGCGCLGSALFPFLFRLFPSDRRIPYFQLLIHSTIVNQKVNG